MKKSIFTNVIKRNNNYILHNTLYNTGMKVISERFKSFIDINLVDGKKFYSEDLSDFSEYIDVLSSQKMITYDNTDETSIVNMLYDSRTHKALNIILIVTRNCNFRCPYCYEEHEPKNMSIGIYDGVIEHIKRRVDTKKYETVNISFFGGEPMLEYDNILKFMRNLQWKLGDGVKLRGQMTTNGFLLEKNKFIKLLEAGINSYQITVDGMRNTHDQTRMLANGDGTWHKIVNNLKFISGLQENYSIVIRTNFTSDIILSCDKWLDFLAENFGKDKRFTYHFEAVKNLGVESAFKTHTAQEEGKDIAHIINKSKEKGLNLEEYNTKITCFSLCCYASSLDSFVIDYNGILRKCSVCIDEEMNNVGQIDPLGDTKNFREDRLAWWTSYDPHPDCLSCSIYPLCYGKKCPNGYFSKDICDTLKQTYFATISEMFN